MWLSSLLAIAWPAALETDTVKITPLVVQPQSSPKLPPEVQTLETQSAPAVFDRDTTSEHTAYESGHLVAQLDRATEIRAIKVYGAAPYRMSVEAEVNGAWQGVAGMHELDLTRRPQGWSTFEATAPVVTARLRFALTPAAGGAASGLKGIEIWGRGARANVKNGAALLSALLGTSAPAHARLYRSTPVQGVIGAAPGVSDDPADNRFDITLERNPADYKRAYLTYQVLGLSHWAHAVRSINGAGAQGGFAMAAPQDDSWSTQVEEIDPRSLARGANAIAFSAPEGAAGPFTVKDVYLIAELESGANFVASATDDEGDATNPAAAVLDGDLASGWMPYPSRRARGEPQLTLLFDKRTQVDGLALHMVNNLRGALEVHFIKDGAWSASKTVVTGAKLVTGWNHIAARSAEGVDGLRLVFTGGRGSGAEVKEVVLSGSGTGPTYNPPRIAVSFPDAGQFFGRGAYIRGFVQPLDNGSGPAQLSVAGRTVPTSDGAFGVRITKDEAGLASQSDAERWSVELKAVYPNGQTATATVVLDRAQAAAEASADAALPAYRLELAPGLAKLMSYDGASLAVPANALGFLTTIGMRPLREQELPALEAGMTNVTKGPRRGYRFTPTPMQFKEKLKLRLPYDKKLIPGGMSENDVRTYYFDKAAGRWRALERVLVDGAKEEVESETDHFTDMINATVVVPDHAQAAAFNPTQIKDVKAADPGAQVNLIEPPRANNQGDARLAYPIEVPPGRQGMQPQLAVQYSSTGANGWMGMGWDVPMQAVMIDTRFGVPRYETAVESETYMVSGEMLTPVAHRGEFVPRTADKVFRTRVEGQFRRIIRRGNHPSNYTWEVTDKNGVKYLYGATNPATETLSDAAGNRFLWALCEIRDPNGNFVKYHYQKVIDPGVGTVEGSNIYLQRITYTGSGITEGQYEVKFIRDRDPELGEPRRVDVQIDARGGFKRVTADLLRKIKISFGGATVRSYEFRYNENPYGDNRPALAFNKTLLTSVSQFGADDALFNKHNFTYYDEARDVAGNYRGFTAASDWSVGNDGIGSGLFGRGAASALGGTQSTSRGVHSYFGKGGFDGRLFEKSNTSGFKVGSSRSENETLLTMADMNGDGLPDKVFKVGSGAGSTFWYRPNLSGPNGTPSFGDPPVQLVSSVTLRAIGLERVTSTTAGAESFSSGTAVSGDINFATTEGSTYFTDVNGDGLTDLVHGGQVLFGFVNAAGVPTFSANSADTPVAIGAGAIDTTNLLEDAAAIEAERAANFPLLDTLRRWVAPYDGVISINAPVALIQDTSPERAQYTGADGVRVAIQLEASELWSTTIAADDYTPKTPAGVNAVPVTRGQRLYFRVQSVLDGAFDQVSWNPEISYTGVDTTRLDVNDLAEYRYLASADFTLFGRSGATVTMPLTGTVRLAGSFEKTGATTDDVRLVVTRNGTEVFSRTLLAAETANVTIAQDLSVAQLDVLEWRIFVDSPIDATRVKLTPSAHYTAADGLDQVTDEQGNFIVQVSPPFSMDLYPVTALTAPQGFFTVPTPATSPLAVQARVQISGLANGETANATFTVKRRGALLLKRPVTATGTGAPFESVVITEPVNVNAGDQLFFDLSSRDPSFPAKVTLLDVRVGTDGDADGLLDTQVPSALHTPAAEGLFAQPYRGWGAAGYNGNSPRNSAPIDQSLLVVTDSFDPNNTRAYPFVQEASVAQWGGVDELAWVKAGTASSSRLGLDDIRMPTSAQFAGAAAPARMSRSRNVAVGAASVTGSTGTSESDLDFQDLNGDRFPDVVSRSGGVQFTRPVGGLESGRRGSGPGSARKSNNDSVGASSSLGGNIAVAIGNDRGQVVVSGQRHAASGQQGMDMASLGFSVNAGLSKSDSQHDLFDINGDGLLDKVFRDGTVALNLGYSFAAAEPWSGGIISDGTTISVGGGLNLGFNKTFYSLAGGLSLTINESKSDEVYADINGDGLPDKIKIVAGNPFSVRLNTGAGISATEIAWPGGHGKVAVDKHITLGKGAFFTIGIPIPPVEPVTKIVINPGVHSSTSMGRPEFGFRDVDGDGFADHVFSERDSQLKVALNPIGRTNLLKKVHRPLGATFDLEYTRNGNTFDLPQSRWVMTKVNVFDGHVGEGADRQVSTFTYAAPKYNRLEREFFGYGTVVERHHDTQASDTLFRSIQREYLTDNYYTKGLLKKEVVQDASARPFTESENTYVLRNVETGVEPADGSSTTATIFPQLSRTDRRFYEGQTVAQKSTAMQHQYDALGNMTRLIDTGDVGAQDDVDAVVTYTAADPACVSTHIVGKARSIVVTGNAVQMRRREATVDCATGDVTQVRQFLETGQAAVTDLAYFPNGNLQTVTGPANKIAQRYRLDYLYDPQLATHVARITDSFGLFSTAEYDLRFGKPTTTVDTNGQRMTYAYDAVGRADTVVGPYEQGSGQLTIDFDYAAVATATSDAAGNTIPISALPFALTKHIDKDANGALKATGTIDTVLLTDGLKRVLQTKKDAAVHTTPSGSPGNVMIVSGQVRFDAFGRTVEQFYPVTEAKGAGNTLFNAAFDTVTPTTMAYDVLDRNTRTTIPDGTFTTLAYGFGADRSGVTQFQSTVTDANGKQKHSFRDVRELITTVKEFNPAGAQSVIQTSYAYDALKQITRVVDDRNNTTTVAYDNLGRRTIIDNPDSGRTETVYDLASNVIAKVTAILRAEGKQVNYDYDFNRLTAIRYPTFALNNVTYTYGTAAQTGDANGNRAGRITRITDASGTEERFYGRLGESVREVKTLPAALVLGSVDRVYTTQYQYDTWNRLMKLTYPDGEVLTYTYDSGGLVTAANGVKAGYNYPYLTRLDYDKFEQRVLLDTGLSTSSGTSAGTRTLYTYRPDNRRLATLKANLPGGSQYRFHDLAYTYDAVGNIRQLQNLAALPGGQSGIGNELGGPSLQDFVYDDLYRLTQASGQYQNKSDKVDRYTLTLAYDAIHNITQKSQVHELVGSSTETQVATTYAWAYGYQSAKPHAPTTIGPYTFVHDANGNQMRRFLTANPTGPVRQLLWDEDNRLACTHADKKGQRAAVPEQCSRSTANPESRYTYNHQGERVVKEETGATLSFYINPNFSEKGTTGLKHVFVGTSRLATKMVQSGTSFEDLRWFYHADHLSSTSMVTSEKGELAEYVAYFPFGETWVHQHQVLPMPFQFTGKELDNATKLYYFGARYYDPRTSMWQSTDPILEEYLPAKMEHHEFPVGLPKWSHIDMSDELKGRGGVFNSINLSLYSYAANNPVTYVDPDGRVWKLLLEGLKQLVKREAKEGARDAAKQAGKEAVQQEIKREAKQEAKEAVKQLSKQQERAIRSLEKRIAEHEKKLKEFKENPTVRPGMEKRSAEEIQKQQQMRMEHLEKEIETFKSNIEKVIRGEMNP